MCPLFKCICNVLWAIQAQSGYTQFGRIENATQTLHTHTTHTYIIRFVVDPACANLILILFFFSASLIWVRIIFLRLLFVYFISIYFYICMKLPHSSALNRANETVRCSHCIYADAWIWTALWAPLWRQEHHVITRCRLKSFSFLFIFLFCSCTRFAVSHSLVLHTILHACEAGRLVQRRTPTTGVRLIVVGHRWLVQ